MTSDKRTVGVTVTGRVQGVGLRAWTRSEARALGLAGWVRNEPDGSVSALFSGQAGDVAAMLDRLRKGPPGAEVRDLTAQDTPAGGLHGFDIRS